MGAIGPKTAAPKNAIPQPCPAAHITGPRTSALHGRSDGVLLELLLQVVEAQLNALQALARDVEPPLISVHHGDGEVVPAMINTDTYINTYEIMNLYIYKYI